MFGINLPNPLSLAEKAFDAFGDLAGGALKNAPLLAGLAGPQFGLVAGLLGPATEAATGLIDFIKPDFKFPFPTKSGEVDSSFQGVLDSITGLGGEIDDLKQQLQNPDLTADQRMELSFKMQEKMQERMQMITMLTNLMKSEHDGQMAITNNFRV